MMAFGMATTSALTVRVHGCIGAYGAAAVAGVAAAVFAGAVAGAVAFAVAAVAGGVSVLAASLSVFAVSGFDFSSAATATFGAGFAAAVVNSATGLSTAAGVCAFATAAVNKLKTITVNEEIGRAHV